MIPNTESCFPNIMHSNIKSEKKKDKRNIKLFG